MARKLKLRRGAIVETRDGSVLVVRGVIRRQPYESNVYDCTPMVATDAMIERAREYYFSRHELKVKGYADDI